VTAVPTKTLRGDRCLCRACGEFFNSTFMFDKHRRGKYPGGRRCLTPAELEAKGHVRNEAGFWISTARETVPEILGPAIDPGEGS
jgi:hypothetical protein